ncbi:MAG: nuclear transport factor 2 family protein [Coriobacteriales bacterium]|nr:nuclear transport factor 2 family protein [Coriobacteriales bacterium]
MLLQYEWYLDHGYDGEGIASLFTEDGLWEIEGVGGVAQGHDAIVNHAANLVKSLPWGQHNMLAPMITVEPDGMTATGTFCLICTLTLIEESGEEAAYIEIGKYRNTYVKVDGEWKFQHLYGNMEKVGRWELGWVADSLVKEEW